MVDYAAKKTARRTFTGYVVGKDGILNKGVLAEVRPSWFCPISFCPFLQFSPCLALTQESNTCRFVCVCHVNKFCVAGTSFLTTLYPAGLPSPGLFALFRCARRQALHDFDGFTVDTNSKFGEAKTTVGTVVIEAQSMQVAPLFVFLPLRISAAKCARRAGASRVFGLPCTKQHFAAAKVKPTKGARYR